MMRNIIPVFLFFFLLSFPYSSYSLRLSHPPILTVRGDGMATLPVDEAEITATIQSRIESPTPIIQASETNRTLISIYLKSVANKTAAITERVKNYLSSIDSKIKKLRTTSLSNAPLTQWKDGLMFYYGADASHSFAFQTSTNNSGPIIDELIRIGVSRIDGVRLVSSDEAIRLSRMRALSNATKNAWNKIQATVRPFGWNIGSLARNNIEFEENVNTKVDILSMNIEGVTIRPPPQPRETFAYAGFARMDAEVPAAPPMPSSNVFSSDTTMSASVILRVRLNKKNTTSISKIPEENMITAADADASEIEVEDEIEEAVMEQYNNENNM